MNTGVVIINTTTTSTSHPIDLQNCINYKASVTPFLQDYKGDAAVIMKNTPGGGKSCGVQYYNTCFSTVFVHLKATTSLLKMHHQKR